jgi:hypothetical protein
MSSSGSASDLFDLISLVLAAPRLDVQNFRNFVSSKDMMISTNPPLEPQCYQQATEVVERDCIVGPS